MSTLWPHPQRWPLEALGTKVGVTCLVKVKTVRASGRQHLSRIGERRREHRTIRPVPRYFGRAGNQPTGTLFCWRSPLDSLALWAIRRLSYPLRRSTMQAWSFLDDREVRNQHDVQPMPPAGRIGRGSKHRRPWSLASVDESRNSGDQLSSCTDSSPGDAGGVLRHGEEMGAMGQRIGPGEIGRKEIREFLDWVHERGRAGWFESRSHGE